MPFVPHSGSIADKSSRRYTKNKMKKDKIVYLREIEIRYKNKRVKNKSTPCGVISCAGDAAELFRDLENETKEKLITVNLDSCNKILCFEVVAIGSLKSVFLRPMEVFRTAFPVNAHAAIVIHNHPSGNPKPSQADKKFTSNLRRLAKDMGLTFYDHIIIGQNSYFSFLENGLMKTEIKNGEV